MVTFLNLQTLLIAATAVLLFRYHHQFLEALQAFLDYFRNERGAWFADAPVASG